MTASEFAIAALLVAGFAFGARAALGSHLVPWFPGLPGLRLAGFACLAAGCLTRAAGLAAGDPAPPSTVIMALAVAAGALCLLIGTASEAPRPWWMQGAKSKSAEEGS